MVSWKNTWLFCLVIWCILCLAHMIKPLNCCRASQCLYFDPDDITAPVCTWWWCYTVFSDDVMLWWCYTGSKHMIYQIEYTALMMWYNLHFGSLIFHSWIPLTLINYVVISPLQILCIQRCDHLLIKTRDDVPV